jgi:GNAT superfamily N-acetyltransferase
VTDPRNFIVAETLRDGTAVSIRAIRPDDKRRVFEAFANLDRKSVFTRFFNYKTSLTDAEVKQFTDVDFDHAVALVVTIESRHGEEIIAGGRYVSADTPRPGRSAELAFTTEENYQARGIAGLLLGHLVQIARENGILQLEADVLAENRAMLTVFRRSGLPMQQHHDGDVIHVTLWLGPEKRGSQR